MSETKLASMVADPDRHSRLDGHVFMIHIACGCVDNVRARNLEASFGALSRRSKMKLPQEQPARKAAIRAVLSMSRVQPSRRKMVLEQARELPPSLPASTVKMAPATASPIAHQPMPSSLNARPLTK